VAAVEGGPQPAWRHDGTPGKIETVSAADGLSALAGRKAVAEAGPFRPIRRASVRVDAILRVPRRKRADLAP
jgi:hypothetical protein